MHPYLTQALARAHIDELRRSTNPRAWKSTQNCADAEEHRLRPRGRRGNPGLRLRWVMHDTHLRNGASR